MRQMSASERGSVEGRGFQLLSKATIWMRISAERLAQPENTPQVA